ncbi:hypothetical protein VTL71DRAFT_4157 [Oculimacula yallundae]|uniref:Uncharacterized protein n=1 Tax=Oculimacula yallundae TaxID=86028 RepID=A0ABR4C4Z9_9HELO
MLTRSVLQLSSTLVLYKEEDLRLIIVQMWGSMDTKAVKLTSPRNNPSVYERIIPTESRVYKTHPLDLIYKYLGLVSTGCGSLHFDFMFYNTFVAKVIILIPSLYFEEVR